MKLTLIKTKNNQPFVEELDFNPIAEGWELKKLCCCKAKFEKEGNTLITHKEGNEMVLNNKYLPLPESQAEFIYLTHGRD